MARKASSSTSPLLPTWQFDEAEVASSIISDAAHPDANIFWGLAFDDDLQDEMRITVIATGFENENSNIKFGGKEAQVKGEHAKKAAEPVEKEVDFDDIMGLFRNR